MQKVGRNDPCPCGSGKKYKKCCEEKLERKKINAQLLPGNQALAGRVQKLSGLFKQAPQPHQPNPQDEPKNPVM